MPRMLFEKTGNAIWISHLDLMRLFQRAFKRAGLPLTHTQGFNPRPSVSIALPLSVGTQSHCELLDFDLDHTVVANNEICRRLNEVLVAGIRVLDVYDGGRKLRELSLMRCRVILEYDNGVAENSVDTISKLFGATELIVSKKTKNGMQDQDIIPMIRDITVSQEGEDNIVMTALICCQNPTLNPSQLIAAIDHYLPELRPDYSSCYRLELFDDNNNVFR